MWKEFSIRYITHNKFSSSLVAGIIFVATTFLSLISGVFYNLWMDYVVQQKIKNPSYVPGLESIVVAYLFVLAVAVISLIIMIHNAFEASMNSRVHQMGILQSIGATPKQIRIILLQEVGVLCIAPILAGVLMGLLLCYLFVQTGITFSGNYDEYKTLHYEVRFYYHIMVFLISVVLSMITVVISAWIPARRLSKLSPIEAINYGEEVSVKRMRRYSLFTALFGVYGELARKSIYSRRKILRTTTVSFAFSFLAFISFLNFETISYSFVQNTYFDRYADIWDVIFTVSDQYYEEEFLSQILSIDGVESCIEYKKIEGETSVSSELFSTEVTAIGLQQLFEDAKFDQNGNYVLKVPIFILDNESFSNYCVSQNLETNGAAVLVNTTWDRVNSDFSKKRYIPLLKADAPISWEIANPANLENELFMVTATAFTESMPAIKEESSDNSINLVVSESYYQIFASQLPYMAHNYNIRITSDTDEEEIVARINTILNDDYQYNIVSRLKEAERDAAIRKGLNTIISAIAFLLACIGLANIFSVTIGQLYQRKKEFARYFSLGMSLNGMKKILLSEALIVSFRPLILSLLINIPVLAWALTTAGISVGAFLIKAPYVPVLSFSLVVFLVVGFSYYLVGRQLCKDDIVINIKDESFSF